MNSKLSDAEMTIMQILWSHGKQRATHIADMAKEQIGWEKNTTYTFLHRLIKKGAVIRHDPGFHCEAACEREAVLSKEAHGIVEKLYNGSIEMFVHAFLNGKPITANERERLQKLIDAQK